MKKMGYNKISCALLYRKKKAMIIITKLEEGQDISTPSISKFESKEIAQSGGDSDMPNWNFDGSTGAVFQVQT